MSSPVATLPQAASETRGPTMAGLPWYCFAVVLGAACIPVGALWDISWHSTIGRDSFWNPAHIVIYLGGVVPGLSCGWLVLKTTFWGTPEEKGRSVGFIGFQGPLGAWITIWGALAMLFSAPFDNWWHDAYGLDVAILSPPHTLLAMGMYAVATGALLQVLSWQNRTTARARMLGSRLFVFTAGVLLAMATIIVTEKSYPNHQHTGLFYKIACGIFPMYLALVSRASSSKWGATGAAATYTAIELLMLWGLPLFHAVPKLAPIYNPVDHMVPPPFPLLVIVPAVAIDLIMRRLGDRKGPARDWATSALIAVAFLGLFLPTQWFFSEFMLSPGSDNWFFAGGNHWPFFTRPGKHLSQFWSLDTDPLTLAAVGAALALAFVKSRIGLALGSWMSRVQR